MQRLMHFAAHANICSHGASPWKPDVELDGALDRGDLTYAWALRWLTRWISEAPDATIERAAEVAASLADLPAEPTMLPIIEQRL